jgi:hypothetical protein
MGSLENRELPEDFGYTQEDLWIPPELQVPSNERIIEKMQLAQEPEVTFKNPNLEAHELANQIRSLKAEFYDVQLSTKAEELSSPLRCR